MSTDSDTLLGQSSSPSSSPEPRTPDPVAICGVGVRVGEDVTDLNELWNMIVKEERENSLEKNEGNDEGNVTLDTPPNAQENANTKQLLLEATHAALEDSMETNYQEQDACVGFYLSVAAADDTLAQKPTEESGGRKIHEELGEWISQKCNFEGPR